MELWVIIVVSFKQTNPLFSFSLINLRVERTEFSAKKF
jgi:hypothetical protein